MEGEIETLIKTWIREIVKEEVSIAFSSRVIEKKPVVNEGGYDFAADVTRLSKKYIYTLKSKGLIPCKTWGGRPLFSRQELEEWMREGMPDPKLEKAAEFLRIQINKKKKK